ncbi:very-long-chain (3R)-3-hydroxyacyl-CoA dehydratase 2 [Exaiptasia diaphana]|uniref:Very-long-chain (3R)-3-hydroxyacyl-CoA dehydratase n=1 Tax=Exaiptasia diaphana TaxID=2652724 RepID=A0A913WX01_EXADI|nr:very-long-chain (3R)-3-hydroxyacyl-CoA dehydratase 2 [Exaiptasia diaphana]XP_020895375.1 very-long-chain (3R)-3-hydroxyacyl-CoA dehydratase 2 [Exaiptasia diaphana]KXJ27736.1 Very-long-chain (3R)-3-hydroxyacyl-CoA dehydratase 2 [Exaiptasia diaphana]
MAAGTEKKVRRLPQTVTLYLVLYNAIQAIGWSLILFVGISHFVRQHCYKGLYSAVRIPLLIFQTAAILEVVHCAVGYVRSSVFLTGFQVASRLFLTWAVVYSIPQVQDCLGVAAFIFAWSLTEVIRYSFYVCSLVSVLPYALQWCRYTFFIFLYPIGVTGELFTIYTSLPFVKASNIYSYPLPNMVNFGFSYYVFLVLVMFSYIPIFPQLYFHMLAQRQKIISSPPPKKQD